VNPFEGLMVDATTWSDEQNYHRDASRIHLLLGHGWGIVDGLEVTVDAQSPNGLIVRSGVAIDPLGRTLLVARDTRLDVAPVAGPRYFVPLSYAEQPVRPQSAWDGSDHATRVVESAELSVEPRFPAPPAIELARFLGADALRDAEDPTNPQTGEVD